MKFGIPQVKNDTDLSLKCITSKHIEKLTIHRKATVAIVVFDVTSSETFLKSQHWQVIYWLIYFRIQELNEKAPAGIQIVLVGNKIDSEER